MVAGIHRSTRLIVDLEAIKQNIRSVKAPLQDDTEVFAVVKANAYGLGLVPVGKTAIEAGASGLCVAILDEGLALRAGGITAPILELGIVMPEIAIIANQHDISVSVGSIDWLKQYQKLAQEAHLERPLKVHLALDTGMGRIGFTDVEEFKLALQFIQQPEFIFEGLFTHFATADEKDHEYFDRQSNKWDTFMKVVDQRPRYVHVANSATSLWHLKADGNMIRLGAGMYGFNPSGRELEPPILLHSAASLVAKMSFVKQIHPGDGVSYGATYRAKQDEWIGTVALGYADGYPRNMQGFHVIVDGQYCEIVGRVCMDQLMIRLPHEYPVGTEVTIFGRNGSLEITNTDIADYSGTINYEIMTSLSERIQRVYRE